MKKLGIIANINNLEKIPGGDIFNYVKFLLNYFREKRDIIAINWRDIDKNLNVKRHLKCTKEGFFLQEERVCLNKICDLLFIKNLGKIYKEQKEFLDFLKYLDKFEGRVTNPIKAIKNNLTKQYILDFQKKGFPVVPTREIKENMGLKDLKNLDFSSNKFYMDTPKEFIVKPKVFGEQGNEVRKLSSFKNELEFQEYFQKNKPVIIQPLIEEIKNKGENSFVFLGKNLIHSVNKFTGKFKINCCKGILCTIHEPSESEIKLCEKIMKSWPDEIDYIRIDFIPYRNGNLISEIEIVNPAFYIENILSLKDNFAQKLENFFLEMEN